MILIRFVPALVLFCGSILTVDAREFRCTVTVNIRQLQGSGFAHLMDLEELIEAYFNNNNWTTDSYQPEEWIECSAQLIFLESRTLTSFRAQFILTSTRPIYGTTAKTTLLQISDDKWELSYARGTPLVFETERFDPLTSVLDFYAYVMLGYDYDSFSQMGGEVHFQKAKRIQQLANSRNAQGWSTLTRDPRGELIDQLTAPHFKPIREVLFQYHYHGLDHFIRDQDKAREAVLAALIEIQTLYRDLSRQYVFDVFFSSKYTEITAIFLESDLDSQAFAVLTEVDPAHLTKYNELVQ